MSNEVVADITVLPGGITRRAGVEYLYYGGVDSNEFRIPRHASWAAIRACVDDAERLDRPATSAYGCCPHCGAPGQNRERRPYGNDTCRNGHVYPSAAAVHGAAR